MKKLTEKEILAYEKAFEDGYKTAKRIYKPFGIRYLNENGDILKTK